MLTRRQLAWCKFSLLLCNYQIFEFLTTSLALGLLMFIEDVCSYLVASNLICRFKLNYSLTSIIQFLSILEFERECGKLNTSTASGQSKQTKNSQFFKINIKTTSKYKPVEVRYSEEGCIIVSMILACYDIH